MLVGGLGPLWGPVWGALVVRIGFYAKFGAEPWYRELCSPSVARDPGVQSRGMVFGLIASIKRPRPAPQNHELFL